MFISTPTASTVTLQSHAGERTSFLGFQVLRLFTGLLRVMRFVPGPYSVF